MQIECFITLNLYTVTHLPVNIQYISSQYLYSVGFSVLMCTPNIPPTTILFATVLNFVSLNKKVLKREKITSMSHKSLLFGEQLICRQRRLNKSRCNTYCMNWFLHFGLSSSPSAQTSALPRQLALCKQGIFTGQKRIHFASLRKSINLNDSTAMSSQQHFAGSKCSKWFKLAKPFATSHA